MTFAALVRILVVVALFAATATRSPAAHALDATPAAAASVVTETTLEFPSGMRFAARLPVDDAGTVGRVELLYRIGPDETLNLAAVPSEGLTQADGAVEVALFVDMQAANFVPVGVELTFSWAVYVDGALALTTRPESAMWADPRFPWTTIRTELVTLHSYGLSDGFARRVLDTTEATMAELEQRYALKALQPITVWIYDSSADFSAVRQSNSREAISGLSYPAAGVIAAVIPEGNERELGRVLPHEVSHHVLHQATMNPLAPPPLWLDEGLATRFQIGGTDQYAEMVARAEAEDRLFDIASLEASFPFQPAQASLAYASSWSMVGYIEATYGNEGIARLIAAFGEGRDSGAAIRQALGIDAAQLNEDWHAWVANQDAAEAA